MKVRTDKRATRMGGHSCIPYCFGAQNLVQPTGHSPRYLNGVPNRTLAFN